MKKKSPMKNPGIQIESSYKLTVQKPKFQTEDSNHKSKLFDSISIETDAAPYNLITPGISQSDKTNVSTSPALLAMGTKNHRARSTMGPSVVRPIISNVKMSTVQDFNSLLTKKPLSELPIPPQKKVTTVAQQNENERNGLLFKDDPITYFSKHKDDGMGHRFIYLKYAKSKSDPYFSPYELIKTPFCDAGEDYFTMSASGITHVDEFGNTETCSLDSWVKEETDFAMIRRLRLFKLYLFWKPFKFWRTFVQRQRYKELTKEIKSIPSLYNVLICKSQISISKLTRKFDKLMNETLLILIPEQKYVLKDYEQLCIHNNLTLQKEYQHFIHSAVLVFTELYDQISNPNKLLVQESEFDEIKRKNPNIGRLIILEQKKAEKKIQNDEKMKIELNYLQNTIRMADYMFLEILQNNCCKSLQQAFKNVESESSAIFNAEITFNEKGEVAFVPNESTLSQAVIDSIDLNLKTLENLPRILFQPELLEFIQKKNEYPTLAEFFSSSEFIPQIKENICKIISKSYHDAFVSSKSFCDYYPLFKLAKEWNVRNYIKTSSGNIYEGPLNINERNENETYDSFLINYEKEPIVDIQQMSIVIDKLQKEQIMVGSIRSGFISGCIYIDSRSLKGRLTPIPLRSLNEIEKTLADLINLKIELMNRVFKYYSKLLKTESTALEIFINFCSLLKKIQSLLPNMNSEISFVDEVVALFEQSNFKQQFNPLHETYAQFKNEFQSALSVKNNRMDTYLLELKKFSYKQTRKLDKYYNLSLLLPKNLQDFDVDNFSMTTEKLKRKIKKMKDSIKTCLNYQKVLETEQSQFDQYKDATQNIKTAENLIVLYKLYQEVYKQVTQIPFEQVNFDLYESQSEKLKEEIEKMNSTKKNPAVFTEISNSFNSFSPFSEELLLLYNGKMQERHWERLFDECCKKGKYHNKITIHDLIKYNIVGNIGRIKKITEISLNEYKLESEFKEISTHWSEVHIPLANAQAKTEMTMILGPLDNLIIEINDTSIRLHTLLNNPFINGIKADIQNLTDKMDNIIKILKAWQIFQPNWIIVSTMFQQEAIQQSISKQQTRFATVKRKYGAIVRHVLNNTRLINVCTFQSLLEDLQENSRDLEIILKDLISFTNLKRMKIPRLFFLSDNELLTMMSTTNFNVFASLFVKTLMHIQKIDAHSKDAAFIVSQDTSKEMCNFNGMSIFSITGQDCENFVLTNQVMCTGPLEDWSSLLYKSIKESFKIEFKKNLNAYKDNSLSDYIFTSLPYFSLLVNSVVFTENVEDCFQHFETNQRIFHQFETQLIEREAELLNTLTSPLSSSEILKISNLIAAINMNIDRVHSYQDKIQHYSHKLKWESVFKHRYNPTTDVLYCEFEDYQIPHNLEYWGDSPQTIINIDNDININSILNFISLGDIPMLYGPFASGKSNVIEYLAFMFGRFYFQVQPFSNLSKLLIDQYLIGAAETGSFLFFRNINEMEIEKIEYLFDKLHIINSHQIEKKNVIKYNKNDKIEIDLSTRFFMSRRIHCEIPPPLKTFTRPIAIRTPSITKIIEIMLKSHGFKSFKNSSTKLNSFLNSVISLLDIQKSIIHYSMKIIKNAFEYLMEIIHANRCPFVNYYEETRTAEEFSIALAAYQNISYMIDDHILILILYSHFTIFDNFDIFKEHIRKPNCFAIDKFEASIAKYLENKLLHMNIDLPSDYLINKLIDLFNLMKNYTAIVIYGEPNTGKSILVQLLVDIYQNFYGDSKIKGLLPIKLAKVFHNSDSFKNEFGIQEYLNKGQNESKLYKHNNENGEILSALTYLNRFEETHHRILHLDGVVDSTLAKYLINSTFDQKKLLISSGDTFLLNNSLHILIETDTIDSIPNEFKSFVGIITMKSCQYESIHPSIPFSMASLQFDSIINETTLSEIRSIFCEICSIIFLKILSMKNDSNIIYLFNSYCRYAIELTLSEINENYLGNTTESELFKLSLIFSMFRVFSTVLSPNQIIEFDEFLRKTFELNFPTEWVGFGLPNSYWDIYPTPSVMSLRISKKKINPHNFNILNLNCPDYVPVAQFLPNITTFSLGLAAHHHFLIFGDRYSGKETFVDLVLALNKHLIPVHVYLNPSTTAYDLKNIILKQSQLTVNETKLNSLFLLIFHHLDECKLEVFEFIRMIIVSKSLPVTSAIDVKVYNSISLNNFIVLCTLTNPKKVPIRFFSLFTPIYMQNYLAKTKEFIVTKTMMKDNVVNKFISVINFCLRELDLNIVQMLNIAKIVCLMPDHNSSKGFVKEFIVFMSEIQFSVFRDDSDGFNQFKLTVLKICQDFDLGTVFQQYQAFKKILIPKFKSTNQIDITEIDLKELKESLTKLSRRKLTNLEVKQFIYVTHSISKPRSHCEITGPTSSGKMSIIKLYAKKNKVHLIDMAYSNNEILKNKLVESLLMNLPYLIAIRVNKNNMNNLFLLYMVIVLKNYKLLFNDEEQEELYRTLSKTERPTEIQRRDAHFEILNRMECNCHLIILTENELKLANVDVIRLKCDTKEHICDEVLKDLIELKSIFCEIAQKAEDQLPFSHQNQFYDFIKTFDETFKKEQENQKNRSQKINLALSFYDKIIERQKNVTKKMAELKPLVNKLKEKTKEIQDDLDIKGKAVEERKNKLNEELMLKQAEFKQKRQDFLDSDVEYQLNLPKYEAMKQKILEFTDQQLQPLRIYCAAPTPLVKSLSEVCSILTNRMNDPKIFSDYNLVQILTDEIDFKKISDEDLNTLKKIVEKDIDQKQIESGPPILSTIFTYFQRTIKMSIYSNTCKSKQTLVNQAQKALDTFNETMKKEYDEIAEIEATFGPKQSELSDLQKQLEETKSEYQKRKSDKRVIETILKDILILIDKWKEEQKQYQTLSNTLKGDTIVWVVYLIYAGMLPQDKRMKLIDSVNDILIRENIPVSFTNPIEFIEPKLISSKFFLEIDNIPKPLLIDFHHLSLSVRVPLIIDIDGLVLNSIKESKQVYQISLNSLSFEKVACEMYQKAQYLLVTDVDRLTPLLTQMIGGDHVILYDNQEVIRNDDFHLILFTDNPNVEEFNSDLLSRVSLINTTNSSLDGVKTQIIYSFVEYFDSDLLPRVIQSEKLEIAQQEEIDLYENSALDLLAQMSKKDNESKEYVYLDDSETISEFCKSKDCYFAYHIQTDSYHIKKELELTIHQYKELIDVCYNVWLILTRYIKTISPIVIKLSKFLSTISNVFVTIGIHTLTNEQIPILKNALLNAFYQLIFPSLSHNEILLYIFLISYFSRRLPVADLEMIFEHISSEYDGKALFDQIDGESSISSDNLKFTSIDHIFQIIYKFNNEVLGRDYLNFMPSFNIDNALSAQISFLYSDDDKEPTNLLMHYISLRNMSDNVRSITLNELTIEKTKKLVIKAIKEGFWFIINYPRSSIKSSLLINEIPTLLKSADKVHDNFKLVLNCRTTDHLSNEILEMVKFLRIDSFPSVRETMQEIYHHHSPSLKVLEHSNNGRKIAYLSALVFAQNQYRNFLNPCGFNVFSRQSVWSFIRIISLISKFIEMSTFSIRNYREFLEQMIISNSVIDNYDKLKIKNILSTFITSESFDDSFSFLDPDSTESDKWLISSETTIQGYTQFISKMPSFAGCDFLSMPKKPGDLLLNWNLSRYVSLAFKKLYESSKYMFRNLDDDGNDFNYKAYQQKQEDHYISIRKRLLHQIPIPINYTIDHLSPLTQFWSNEATEFNKFIDQLNIDLTINEIKIEEGVVPQEWQKYKSIRQLPQFISFLNEKRSFLVKQFGRPKNANIDVDISMVSDVRAFFNAYMSNYACEKQINMCALYYEFTFGEGNEHKSLVIENLVMMIGKIENGLLVPSEKPFNKLPKLFCKICKRTSMNNNNNSDGKIKIFNCPIYKFVCDSKLTSIDNFQIHNELMDNFVINIPLQSEKSEKYWVMNGTSILCNMPSQFVPV